MKKIHVVLLGILLAALGALLFLLLPVTANLIIAYAFWLVAILFAFVSVSALGAKNNSLIMELPLFIKARFYLIATAVVSIIVLTLEHTGGYTLPVLFHLAAQLALLIVVGIQVTTLMMGKSHIEQVGEKAATSRKSWMDLVADVNAMKSKADALPEADKAKVKKAIADVSDALRYADYISTDAVAGLDNEISMGVNALSEAVISGKAQDSIKTADNLLAQIRERRDRLKNSK